MDRWTRWLQAYATLTKNARESVESFKQFLGPFLKALYVYSDNSEELEKAMKDLGFPHDTSRPNCPQTNGVAERAVRRVKEATSCALVQSGFNDEWWEDAMMCALFLANVMDVLLDGETSYKKRFEVNFQGPIIPFGAAVEYKPTSQKDRDRLHKMGKKTLLGIHAGYSQRHGGGWNEDLLIYDQEEIAAAENASEVYIKRVFHKTVFPLKEEGKFTFPLARGDLSQPGPRPRTPKVRRKKKQRESEE